MEYFGKNLKYLREQKGLNQSQMVDYIGIKQSTWGGYETGKSFPNLKDFLKIAEVFGISETELLHKDLCKAVDEAHLIEKKPRSQTAQKTHLITHPSTHLKADFSQNRTNEMIANEPSEAYNFGLPKVVISNLAGHDNIVHVPVKARAGYLTGYGDGEFFETLPTYTLPGLRNGIFRSFEVEGHSMKPTMLNRDYVVGEWCESVDHIREGRVHIIVTISHGIVIKRVLNRIKERNKLYLKSDNIAHRGDYPIIELEPEEIKEIWYARMRFTPDFSEPGEVYNRLNDLEIALMDVQKHLKIGQ